jgi:tetratricopeptide (TPR) repeat protein
MIQKKTSMIIMLVAVMLPMLKGIDISRQNQERFAEYLYKNGDYSRASYEYLRVLHLFENNQQEILRLNLKIGKCFGFLNDYENATKYFNVCLNNGSKETVYKEAVIHMGWMLFKQGNYAQSMSFLREKQPSRDNQLINTLILADSLCSGDAKRSKELIETYITEKWPYLQPFERYLDILNNIKKKSPIKAGLMSAILPGSGRIYSGRIKEGLISMVSFFATTFLAYEGFRDQGVKSFRGWLFGSISALLYIGNIYGSVISARITNQRIHSNYKKGIEISLKFYIHD